MAQQAVRDYLRNRGLKDEQITYDNGSVMANGKRFMDATPQADGRTYADSRALDNAYNNYDTMNQLAELRTRASAPNPEMTAMQQALRERINRPVQQFSYDPNTDQTFQSQKSIIAQDTQRDMNNARVEAGASGLRGGSLQNNQMAQLSARNQERLQTQALPQAMAAAYQRYMGQNQLENQQTGNMLGLYGTMSNENQQRYNNAYNLMNQQNTMNQQDIVNDRNDTQDQRQKQQDHISLANYLTSTYGKQVNPTDDPGQSYAQVEGLTPLAMQQYLQQKAMQEAGLTGNYNGAPTMQREGMSFDQGLRNKQFGLSERQANASIVNMGADNVRARQASDLAQARFDWEKDPSNPDNKYKLAQSDPNSLDNRYKQAQLDKVIQDNTTKSGGTDEEKMRSQAEAMVNQLRSGKTTPESALKLIDEDEKFGFYKGDEADQLRRIIYTLSPEYDPAKIAEKKAKQDKPAPFGYRMFGG